MMVKSRHGGGNDVRVGVGVVAVFIVGYVILQICSSVRDTWMRQYKEKPATGRYIYSR